MNIIKIIAETIIAGGALMCPPLALVQPVLSTVLDKAPDSKHLKEIVKQLIDKSADLDDPQKAIAEHAIEMENEIKAYYCEVLDLLNKPTEKVNIMNAGIQDILKSIVNANNIDITTSNSGKTTIEKSHIAADNEVNIRTQSGGHTTITESIVGKNHGMKTVAPKGWEINQPSGWVQTYHEDGSFSIGTTGTPCDSFSIGHNGNPDGNFSIVQEEKPKK